MVRLLSLEAFRISPIDIYVPPTSSRNSGLSQVSILGRCLPCSATEPETELFLSITLLRSRMRRLGPYGRRNSLPTFCARVVATWAQMLLFIRLAEDVTLPCSYHIVRTLKYVSHSVLCICNVRTVWYVYWRVDFFSCGYMFVPPKLDRQLRTKLGY